MFSTLYLSSPFRFLFFSIDLYTRKFEVKTSKNAYTFRIVLRCWATRYTLLALHPFSIELNSTIATAVALPCHSKQTLFIRLVHLHIKRKCKLNIIINVSNCVYLFFFFFIHLHINGDRSIVLLVAYTNDRQEISIVHFSTYNYELRTNVDAILWHIITFDFLHRLEWQQCQQVKFNWIKCVQNAQQMMRETQRQNAI